MDPERAEAWDGASSVVLPAELAIRFFFQSKPVFELLHAGLGLLGAETPGTFHGLLPKRRELRFEGAEFFDEVAEHTGGPVPVPITEDLSMPIYRGSGGGVRGGTVLTLASWTCFRRTSLTAAALVPAALLDRHAYSLPVQSRLGA